MSHVDEGLIHAWIEDQLPPDEAARVERLVATDAAWGAAAAEARGLIAATARVIGALDSAPSAVGGGQAARTGRTRRTGDSWVRSPWLRVAAAVVLVVGLSSVFIPRGDDVTVGELPLQDVSQREANAPTAPPPVRSAPAATPPSVQGPPPQSKRPAPPSADRATVAEASVPPRALAARDEGAAAAKSVAGARDTAVDRRVAGVGAGVGGGGGRGGASLAQARAIAQPAAEVQRSDMMKSFAANPPDSVFLGCWMPVDSSRREAQQANERAVPDVMVLRFTPPVVTDLVGVRPPAAPPVSALQANRGQVSAVGALRSAPARARVQHATPHMKDDSTIVAEWLNADGRTTQLTFRLRGDTLRGTTSTITGDLVIAGSVLLAVRAQCPQP